ncbi:MAG: hypothetical protein K0Q89_570, partial [Thermomicrobiales bacterium]|nr:hypothetical protein [Thermomicrobiales bacterium]
RTCLQDDLESALQIETPANGMCGPESGDVEV